MFEAGGMFICHRFFYEEQIETAVAVAATLLFVTTFFVALRIRAILKRKGEESDKKETIELSELAKLWKDDKTGKFHIKDLAPLWKPDLNKPVEQIERETFENPVIEEFFVNQIEQSQWFDKSIQHKKICYEILKKLDEEGDCSSVVKVSYDTESSWDSTTFQLLAKTSLTNHTLRVAELIVKLALKEKLRFLIPDAMVAALAHDIGKIPSNQSNLYALGEHPLAAGKILSEIALFKDLRKRDDILKTIKMHHKQGEGLFCKILILADQKARQEELDHAVENAGTETDESQNSEKGENTTTTNSEDTDSKESSDNESKQPVKKKRNKLKLSGGSARKADADIYGTDYGEKKKLGNFGQKINIDSWFAFDAFIDNLKPLVNKMEGNRFVAFSMPNGYVFVQPETIMNVTKKIASKAGQLDVPQFEAQKDKQNILLAVVEYCRQEEAIAENMIDQGYFGGYFNVITQNGKVIKGFYTPFHAEFFGAIGELEAKKTGMLKRFSNIDKVE